MKRLTLFVLMLFALAGHSFAQTDTTTFSGKLQYVFGNLSKTPITTGLLREWGIDFVDLDNFTGQVLTDSNWTNLTNWRAIYATLYSEQLNGTGPLVGLDTVNTTISSYTSLSNPVSMVVIAFNYQDFDSSAVTNNLISISASGQLNDVP